MVFSLDTKHLQQAASSSLQQTTPARDITQLSENFSATVGDRGGLQKEIGHAVDRKRVPLDKAAEQDKPVEYMGKMLPPRLAEALKRSPGLDINLDAFPDAKNKLNVNDSQKPPTTDRKRVLIDNAVTDLKEILNKGGAADQLPAEMIRRVEDLAAQDPSIQKAYAEQKECSKKCEALEQELAKKNFPEAKPSRYEYVGDKKYPVYPQETLDGGFVHMIDGKAVVVDKQTHNRIEQAEHAYAKASATYDSLCEKKIESLGLAEYNQTHGLILDLHRASEELYKRSR